MKAVCLISDGIDSPVAAKIMIDKGVEVIFLNGIIENKSKKVKKLVEKISKEAKIYYINHYEFLNKVKQKCDQKNTCVLCKRELYKQAEKLCKKIGADFIITGESIGQVASQTLKNLRTLDQAVKIPIIRPLIGLNKQEIVNIAKELGTFNISIKEHNTCPFVPNKPNTNAKLNIILLEEEKL